jgi:hypothetical protein
MRLRKRARRPAETRPMWLQRQDAMSILVELGHPDVDGHPVLEVFGGLDQALRYVHGCWVTHVGVALDQEAEAVGGPWMAIAWHAWARTEAAHPRLAAILAFHAGHPAIRQADEAHRRLLAGSAGCNTADLPSFDAAHDDAHDLVLRDRRAVLVGHR